MRRKIIISFAILAGLVVISGCGSGDSGNSGACCQMGIYTQTSSGVWPSAKINGSATTGTFSCSTVSDANCFTSFTATTNTSGTYQFSTDALPATWEIGADADANCAGGGSSSGEITNSGTIYVYCNSFNAGIATASPASCTVTINENSGGGQSSNCPGTITLTMPTSTLPTAYALNVTNYSETASEETSSSITPASSTSITVPTPDTTGESAVIVVDPTTNQVIATAAFVVHREIILPGK